uniref:uncharacterized protein LOC101300317 n=1 Tax=Fragaria vesca subsp. vesca TaxID=101020 RepID=UPI0005C832D7|nr:PREDICTED: uncharacterized protein LOC101300317 [Fragaria vesca subsp. vesca]
MFYHSPQTFDLKVLGEQYKLVSKSLVFQTQIPKASMISNPSLIMAPTREIHMGSYSKSKPPTLSMGSSTIQRTKSDISIEVLSKELAAVDIHEDDEKPLPPISEVEEAKCECCGMSEECTAEYINRVRNQFSGKLICGLCAEAVNGEMDKNGGKKDEAVNEHMSACVKFNKLERANPVLYQAEAIKDILRKSSSSSSTSRSKSMSYKSGVQKNNGGLARSSSCIPAITTREVGDRYTSKPSH